MRLWILSLVILAICYISAEGKCSKRNLYFKNREHYTFTADRSKGKAVKALKGSGEILKGRKGQNVSLSLTYVYDRQHELESRGFKGKVCFEMQGASAYYLFGVGIPSCDVSCSKRQNIKEREKRKEQDSNNLSSTPLPCGYICLGGGVYQGLIEIEEKKRGSFKKYCIKARWNSVLELDLVADGDERVQVQNFFIKACEVIVNPGYGLD